MSSQRTFRRAVMRAADKKRGEAVFIRCPVCNGYMTRKGIILRRMVCSRCKWEGKIL